MDDPIDRAERAKQGSPYLNTPQAAHYLGITADYLSKLRAKGEGPICRRHTRVVQYHIDDIDAWSAARAQDVRS